MAPINRKVTVVLSSGGRRVYLVRWFREAFEKVGVEGEVVVLDADPGCASGRFADQFVQVPRFTDPSYAGSVRDTVRALSATLLLSLNDYELEMYARGFADELRNDGTVVLSLDEKEQAIATDKWALAEALGEHWATRTVLASDVDGVRELAASTDRLVVKHRYGSASSGLSVVPPAALADAIAAAERNAPDALGVAAERDARDRVVVQEFLPGPEFGVDGVFPIMQRAPRPAGVVARRKLRMRAGETDAAVSVDPEPFLGALEALGAVLQPLGLVDVDVMLDRQGNPRVIDVNPRFGGGYPFSHLAGADVPSFYVGQLVGDLDAARWLASTTGVRSAKYEDVAVVS